MFWFDSVTFHSLSRRGLVFILLCLAATTMCWSQTDESASAQIERAKRMFNDAKFEETVAMLAPLADDGSLGIDQRKDVYHYLGRCYVIKKLEERALWAITQLIMLTTPPITLDADAENGPTMQVYYEAWRNVFGSDSLRADPGTKTMAILDFGNYLAVEDAAKYDRLQWGFAKLLNLLLAGKVNIQLIDRSRTS